MFEDNLLEYLVATDQIDDVLGTKKVKKEYKVVNPKVQVIKNNEENKNKEIKDKKNNKKK
ncbi:MAG TPA: hypothetical protein PLV83_00175 [Bacilli bacterium]|nr:hypothetical protein [Bacilli bacterium]